MTMNIKRLLKTLLAIYKPSRFLPDTDSRLYRVELMSLIRKFPTKVFTLLGKLNVEIAILSLILVYLL